MSSAQVEMVIKKMYIFSLLLRCIISSVTKTNQRFASRAKGSARHRLGYCLLIISLLSINSLDSCCALRLTGVINIQKTYVGTRNVYKQANNHQLFVFCFAVHRLNVELSRYQAKYRPVSYEVKVKSYRTRPGCSNQGLDPGNLNADINA